MRPEEMAAYGRTRGWTLARGHAASGEPIAIATYLGNGDVFDRAMMRFADIRQPKTAGLHGLGKCGKVALRSPPTSASDAGQIELEGRGV
jgi:Uncharacterized protein conserved in bacteria (DUF2252)